MIVFVGLFGVTTGDRVSFFSHKLLFDVGGGDVDTIEKVAEKVN
jgi:hypothetical protein